MTQRSIARSAPCSLTTALVCSLLAACPGDDTTVESTGAGSSSTSAGGSSSTASPATSSTTAPVSDSSTGTPSCDPSSCEALDLETCAACDPNDCAVLSGYPWREDEVEGWCLEGLVPIACQVGSICFDYYLTLCDEEGQTYYVDMGCPQFDVEAAGFTLCDPPVDGEPFCPTGGSSGTAS